MNALASASSGPAQKRDRQRAILDLVARESFGSQGELAAELERLGFPVTQATVSRDIHELGLVKIPRGAGVAYVPAAEVGANGASGPSGPSGPAIAPSDERLRRIVSDIPVTIGRSGLILLLIGTPGTASVLAQAIDDSTMHEQEGTLAGDNTLLVLFRDQARLERWLAKFQAIQDGTPIHNEALPAGRGTAVAASEATR